VAGELAEGREVPENEGGRCWERGESLIALWALPAIEDRKDMSIEAKVEEKIEKIVEQ